MLKNYGPIYQIAIDLQVLRGTTEVLKGTRREANDHIIRGLRVLLEKIIRDGPDRGCIPTSELAEKILNRTLPSTDADIFSTLTFLNDSLLNDLEKEGIVCVPSERRNYYDRDDLFGPNVSAAFPSCERDIRRAGSCYALAQEDACVHHLKLVLERGLNALATKFGVTFHYADWQKLIDQIKTKLEPLPRGPELDFYRHVNAQFGFLKEAYRKHSAHARDDPYDMPKALSILNHVKEFMQEIEKGGLKE
jgi:hypothetical protein